ncbi:MAG: rhamnulokinase [Vallitaleaceae bacterium]|nr:rhamnulokinase [Vallitaleaceae bacterium]
MKQGIIAVDIGASSGRLILGWLEAKQLKLIEIHRFSNAMSMVNGHYMWDVDYLFHEIIEGLMRLIDLPELSGNMTFESIGIDTWAVDYALIDDLGEKVGGVYAYRDHRTDDTIAKVFEKMSQVDIYEKTGIQFLQFNTLYQLYEHARENEYDFERAKQLLLVPDYLNYRLSGVKAIEYTNATSTQMINVYSRDWDPELLSLVGISSGIMTKPVEPGTLIGEMKDIYQEQTALKGLKVIAPATHDTGSAVVSVPATDDQFAYISSGTWSLMGIETKEPITTPLARKYNFTNEGGAYGTYRFLKNIMGLWLIQEVVRLYKNMYTFEELVGLADAAEPFRSLINPNDDRFLNPENMIKTIEYYCDETNQPIPKTPGQIARCIYESLALLYKGVLDELIEISGKDIKKIHFIGGGCQNEMLNQMCADLTGCEVLTGPIEATAIGNIAVQMITLGIVKDMKAARILIRDSFDIKVYKPNIISSIDKVYDKFKKLGGL